MWHCRPNYITLQQFSTSSTGNCSFLHGMILARGLVSYTFKCSIASQTYGQFIVLWLHYSISCTPGNCGLLDGVFFLFHSVFVPSYFCTLGNVVWITLYSHTWHDCCLQYFVAFSTLHSGQLWLAPWCDCCLKQPLSYYCIVLYYCIVQYTVLSSMVWLLPQATSVLHLRSSSLPASQKSSKEGHEKAHRRLKGFSQWYQKGYFRCSKKGWNAKSYTSTLCQKSSKKSNVKVIKIKGYWKCCSGVCFNKSKTSMMMMMIMMKMMMMMLTTMMMMMRSSDCQIAMHRWSEIELTRDYISITYSYPGNCILLWWSWWWWPLYPIVITTIMKNHFKS